MNIIFHGADRAGVGGGNPGPWSFGVLERIYLHSCGGGRRRRAGRSGPIPRQLQNKHYDGADAAVKGQHYQYAHDFANHWVDQQYLPDAIRDRQYYQFGDNKNEQAAAAYWQRIKGDKFKK